MSADDIRRPPSARGCHRCAAAKDVMWKLMVMEKIFIYILEVLEVLEVLEKGCFQTIQKIQKIINC